jgi:HK97 family phage prohead protease
MENKIIKVFKESIVKDIDEKGVVTVAANAFGNEDADKDISAKGSYTKTISENFKRLRWFLNHDKNILLGIPLEANQTEKHLVIRGKLSMEKQVARDVYADYKLYAEHGNSLEHSVMVQAVKRDDVDDRIVTEWKLWEYSTLTSWGANSETPMLGIKSEKSIQDTINWLEIALKKGNYTDERFMKMDQHLSKLRSLIDAEPESSTLSNEPNIDTINYLKNYKLI